MTHAVKTTVQTKRMCLEAVSGVRQACTGWCGQQDVGAVIPELMAGEG